MVELKTTIQLCIDNKTIELSRKDAEILYCELYKIFENITIFPNISINNKEDIYWEPGRV